GVAKDDNRVFAQFARSVISGQDIVLHTTGDSSKPYCDTIDCLAAILCVLLRGRDGEAYNVANPSTYISIKDMAFFVRDTFAPSIDVKIEEKSTASYAPITKVPLSVDKLLSLGWKPQCGLKEMFEKLIACIK
ncbi:MAG: dTDP-glucose 4,6-dehydratase, partial [Bacteroidaceae bacterium]|nr:dTDP-glucose 4,6-dehydratase [Bacteroidaceae bacterium]